MVDSLVIIDTFVRGVAMGAATVLALAIWRSAISPSSRIATTLVAASFAAWVIAESHTLWALSGHFIPLQLASFPIAGLFWLFVVAVFEDRPLSPVVFAPSMALLGTGLAIVVTTSASGGVVWGAHNAISGAVAVHAGLIIARGWGDDLMEGRRRLRGIVLGLAAVFAVISATMGFAARLNPEGPWIQFTVGHLPGGVIFCTAMVAAAAVFLQARASVFAAPRRGGLGVDSRAEAAEAHLLGKLNAFMAAGGWRQERLAIGAVAGTLGEPEHRLRRLINQRLGHRNFADFVNGFRIEAAKARLSDPAEARTTVAAIAFDLGFGSLGPFNRAFKAVVGVTPTDFRREALASSSPNSNKSG